MELTYLFSIKDKINGSEIIFNIITLFFIHLLLYPFHVHVKIEVT